MSKMKDLAAKSCQKAREAAGYVSREIMDSCATCDDEITALDLLVQNQFAALQVSLQFTTYASIQDEKGQAYTVYTNIGSC